MAVDDGEDNGVMMDGLVEPIAVIRGAPGTVVQELFGALVERWSPLLRIAGVVAESHGLADRQCTAGYLRRIGGEQRFSIFEDLGPGSTACHLDAGGASSAAAAVRKDIAAGCDVVVLSKFGKLEAAGKGLWSAFLSAAEAQIPLLTSVSSAVAPAWSAFTGSRFAILPADRTAIDAWLGTMRGRAASRRR